MESIVPLATKIMIRISLLWTATLLCAANVAHALPAFAPLGPARSPYEETACCHAGIQVSMAADGSFATAWGREVDGETSAWVRRFAADLSPLTPEMPALDGGQLSSAPDGSFALAFLGGSLLRLRYFDQVAQPTKVIDVEPASGAIRIHHDADGGLLVLFEAGSGLYASRISKAGDPVGSTILVSQQHDFESFDFIFTPDGGFEAFFESYNDFPQHNDLFRRRFDAQGQPLGPETLIPPQGPQDTRAAADPLGVSVVVSELNGDGVAQFLEPDGSLGPALSLSEMPADLAYTPVPYFLSDGTLAVGVDIAIDNGPGEIFLLRLDRLGESRSRIQVTEPVDGFDHRDLSMSGFGNRVVLGWLQTSNSNQNSVYFQTFEAPLFADGFESGDLSAWTLVVP